MARGKKKSKPTTSRRAAKQRAKQRLAHAKEDAQALDIIPTRPEETLDLRPERVDPLTQGEQRLDGLALRADVGGWGTSEEAKRAVVSEMVQIVTGPLSETKNRIAAARVLGALDQVQHNRDQAAAGQAAGANGQQQAVAVAGMQVNVAIQNNNEVRVASIDPLELYRGLMNQEEAGASDGPTQDSRAAEPAPGGDATDEPTGAGR